MRLHSLFSLPVILLLAVLAAGLGLWVARRDAPPVTLPPAVSQPSTTTGHSSGTTSPDGAISTSSVSPGVPLPAVASREDEEKLYNWLTGFDDPNLVAEAILTGWPDLTEGGRTAAAPHLLNLVPDERFDAVSEILLAPATNSEVKAILFSGILNRSDAIKWPLILKVMEQKDHPHSQEARNILSVVLNGDYGEDWDRWRSLVETRLVKQSTP